VRFPWTGYGFQEPPVLPPPVPPDPAGATGATGVNAALGLGLAFGLAAVEGVVAERVAEWEGAAGAAVGIG
jgi:hypothetical protein